MLSSQSRTVGYLLGLGDVILAFDDQKWQIIQHGAELLDCLSKLALGRCRVRNLENSYQRSRGQMRHEGRRQMRHEGRRQMRHEGRRQMRHEVTRRIRKCNPPEYQQQVRQAEHRWRGDQPWHQPRRNCDEEQETGLGTRASLAGRSVTAKTVPQTPL